MKRLTLSLALLLTAGLAYAQTPERPMAQAPGATAQETQQVNAKIVAVDPTNKTITFQREGATRSETVPVEGKAASMLKSLQPGKSYTIVCKNDSSGSVKSVVEIHVAS